MVEGLDESEGGDNYNLRLQVSLPGKQNISVGEALRVVHGDQELFSQLLVRVVRRQIQSIEARMRSRQPPAIINLKEACKYCVFLG